MINRDITIVTDDERKLYEELKKREDYPDFANSQFYLLKKTGKIKEMLDFIEENPDCNDEDIIEKWAEFKGIKKLDDR